MPGIEDLIFRGGGGQSTAIAQPNVPVINATNVPSKTGNAVGALIQMLTQLDARAKQQKQMLQMQNLARVLTGQQVQPVQATGVSGAVNRGINRLLGGGAGANPVITQGTTGLTGGSQATGGVGTPQQLLQQMLATGAGTGNQAILQSALNMGQVLNQGQSAAASSLSAQASASQAVTAAQKAVQPVTKTYTITRSDGTVVDADLTPDEVRQEKASGSKVRRGKARSSTQDSQFTKTAEEIARAEFGKPYGKLTQQEQNKVIRRKYREDPEVVKAAMALRKEFNDLPEIKDFKTVRQKFDVMESTFERSQSVDLKSKVALDQSLITLFNKLTDPQSVVRESEYMRTPKNISFVNNLRGKYEKILKGGAGLTDTERQELIETSRVMRDSYLRFYKKTADNYIEIAARSGIDPELVVTSPGGGIAEQKTFNQLPNPSDFKGKIMTDTNTGERYESTGTEWRLIK